MVAPRKTPVTARVKRARGTTPEARENRLVSLAYDQAERQLEQGDAPAMVVVHLLKLRTAEQKLKEEKLRKENLLLEARTSSLEDGKNAGEMYAAALKAIHSYQGRDDEDEDL